MDFCNWYTVNSGLFSNGLNQINCVDIRSENLVKMDNKRNNLIQHTLIRDFGSKDDSKNSKPMGPNDAYNILWKSFQFAKGLEVLQKVYKKLRNQPDSEKKVNFLKNRDKLMKEKPLKVMGQSVSYSDTSLSISIEKELPSFKKALLSDTLSTEFKNKTQKTKKPEKAKRKEVVEKKVEGVAEEERKDLDAHVIQPGRTTSSKRDYQKSKKKNIADLKDIFRDRPIKIPKKEIEEKKEPSIEEEIYPTPEEEQVATEETIVETIEDEAPQRDIEDISKKTFKPPKPKKRTIKKIKEKPIDPPKQEPPPEPTFKLRKILPTDKRRVSETDAVQKEENLKQRKRRWSNDDRYTYKGNVDLSPLRNKMPRKSSDAFDLNKIKLKKVDRKKDVDLLKLREIELGDKKMPGGAKLLATRGRSVKHLVQAIQDQRFQDDEPVIPTVTKIEKASVREFVIPKE